MDLQFDTTDTGEDVRQTTNQVAMFMQASADAEKNPSSGNAQAQPVVSFQWGSYEFKGTMDSFKETIDFFSADGVPLRSLVSISLARQDQVFDEDADFSSSDVGGSLVPTSDSDSATSAATKGGDPRAARQLGADNRLESLRSTGGATLQVNAGIQLNGPAAFAASASVGAGAGLSIAGGAGPSIGAGASVSAGASTGISLSAGALIAGASSSRALAGGGALFGGQASAGVPASAGAFVGLETGRATVSTTTRLDPLRMLRATKGADVSTAANASISLGGAARMGGGFSSNVGPSFNFGDQLTFDAN
jgi:hypothetical protein